MSGEQANLSEARQSDETSSLRKSYQSDPGIATVMGKDSYRCLLNADKQDTCGYEKYRLFLEPARTKCEIYKPKSE